MEAAMINISERCSPLRFKRSTWAEALQALWRELMLEDDQLEELPSDMEGVAEHQGGRLRIRRVGRPSDGCVALEVIDLEAGRIWECGFGQAEGVGSVGFYRVVAGADDDDAAPAWRAAQTVLGEAEDLRTQHQPSFISMAAAYLSGNGLALVADRRQVELLADDLAYWKQLATAQARLLKRSSVVDGPEGGDAIARPALVRPEEPAPADGGLAAPVAQAWQLRDLDEWAARNADRIIVLPRAIAAAKRSEYRSPELAFAALELLAGPYRLAKLGTGSREALGQAVTNLGLSIGGSVDPSQAGMAGSDYFVRWRGRRRFLDQHLAKGVSRDPRFTLRVYFTWDEEDGKAVVGWLPSHLANSQT
jgi:hypothetical protein